MSAPVNPTVEAASLSRSISSALGFFQVDVEDLLRPLPEGTIDGDMSAETSGTHQRRVEHVGTVCRRHNHHRFGGDETVHLAEDLVERLLAFVVPPPSPVPRWRPTASISSMKRMLGALVRAA